MVCGIVRVTFLINIMPLRPTQVAAGDSSPFLFVVSTGSTRWVGLATQLGPQCGAVGELPGVCAASPRTARLSSGMDAQECDVQVFSLGFLAGWGLPNHFSKWPYHFTCPDRVLTNTQT